MSGAFEGGYDRGSPTRFSGGGGTASMPQPGNWDSWGGSGVVGGEGGVVGGEEGGVGGVGGFGEEEWYVEGSGGGGVEGGSGVVGGGGGGYEGGVGVGGGYEGGAGSFGGEGGMARGGGGGGGGEGAVGGGGSREQVGEDGRALAGSMYDADDPAMEPPLLDELGLDPVAIGRRMLAVMNPLSHEKEEVLRESDMAGAILVCLGLGFVLLLTGKVQFGYIYGFGLVGCIALTTIFNLLSPPTSPGISIETVVSVFGYCLLPITALAALGILFELHSPLGAVLALAAVAWATYTATHFFDAALHAKGKRTLLAYPTFLLYAVFALLAVF